MLAWMPRMASPPLPWCTELISTPGMWPTRSIGACRGPFSALNATMSALACRRPHVHWFRFRLGLSWAGAG